MIQVQINGTPLQADLGSMHSMGDLIEFVKATIDPDTIITSVEFNGQSLSDGDWSMPLSAQRDRMLDIRTGTKRAYVYERITLAPEIVQKIVEEFSKAGDAYRVGQNPAGSTMLGTAVDDLSAFVSWYSSLLDMDTYSFSAPRENFVTHVNALQQICEQILQQQLYNSWWVLSETINTKLNPKLNEIKSLCSQIVQQSAQAKAA